jgi:replication-associated recombination protein RarA
MAPTEPKRGPLLAPVRDDPWVRVRSRHDMAAEELVSGLQKCIRRGLVEDGALIAYEMYSTSPELEEKAWSRLAVISVEDVGMGMREAVLLVDALERTRRRFGRDENDRFLFLLHAVRLLCEAQKDRTSDEMTNWVIRAIDRDGRLPEVPEVSLDMHTPRGRALGRGLRHFLEEGAVVTNEVPGRDTTYRKRLFEQLDDSE